MLAQPTRLLVTYATDTTRNNTVVTVYHRTTNYHELTTMINLLIIVFSASHSDVKFADGGHEHCQCGKAVDEGDDGNTG